MTTTLVSSEWLAEHLDDPSIKILEVTAKNKEADYYQGHIPGAIQFYWKNLCWHKTMRQIVTPVELAERLGTAGISDSDTVVVYGDPVQYGTYAFWALTMAGHPALKLLDGSRTRWVSNLYPLTKSIPDMIPVPYRPHTGNQSIRIGRKEIRDNLGKKGRLILDVRSPEEYSGERVISHGQFDHGAERSGRIPGAAHLFFKELFNNDDTLKTATAMLEAFASSDINPEEFEDIICYCRLSHRASLAWTAITHVLGYMNAKVYDGSWTEWGSIVGFPIEK